jgi:putative MFS transporter
MFGWRIMWFLNLPTGLILIGLGAYIPESARFLLHIGRPEEARAMLRRFGSVLVAETGARTQNAEIDRPPLPTANKRYGGTTAALTLVGLGWGFVNFGLLLWLPGELMSEGRDMAAASAIIARSSVIAVPVVVVATYLYAAWSTKRALLTMIAVTALGLVALMLRQTGLHILANPVLPVALLIIGSTGVISILLPYTAENYPLRIRGRATGWVAGCSKSGGLLCQGLSVLAAVPSIGIVALAIAVPTLLGFVLMAAYGRETRGHDLRDLEV